MHDIITEYISAYGYLAIFAVILLLELGMPGLPNELVLFYFGFISHKAGLSFPFVISLAIMADMIGSFLLYLLFYHGKEWLMRIKPAWLPVPVKKITSLKQKIIAKNGAPIFLAKLTPFIRGYLPVVAGLLRVNHALYGRVIFCTAIIWTGGWVTAGWLLQF